MIALLLEIKLKIIWETITSTGATTAPNTTPAAYLGQKAINLMSNNANTTAKNG